MISKNFTVLNPAGFHARPAKEFVQKAGTYPCNVTLIKNDKKANGKSTLSVLTLGLKHLDEVTLETDGEQEEQAIEELGKLLGKIYQE
ncbi:MAG: phosphocarrier protein HPr [Bacilli bacterium]|nr:phosphocarrier protein HPr [Bacilli bacterium]